MAENQVNLQELNLQTDLRIDAVQEAHALQRTKTAQKKSDQDQFTDYLPPKPEAPKQTSIPTLPSPPSTQKMAVKPAKALGVPFNSDFGSEMGLGPTPTVTHPQHVAISILESSHAAMTAARRLTTQTILKSDLKKQRELGDEFHQKIVESIEKAKQYENLSYIKTGLKLLMISMGIVGGIALQFKGVNLGNSSAIFYGAEMTAGGVLSLGSLGLEQLGISSTWTSLLALGGAVASFHGGLMGSPLLIEHLPKHLQTFQTSSMTLLDGYLTHKEMAVQADLEEMRGETETINKKRKVLSETLKKHYGSLNNIKDLASVFQAASEIVAFMNRANSRIIQGTLQG